jgi:hypothetical protein
VIALTDGMDTMSSLAHGIVSSIATRSDAVVHFVALGVPGPPWMYGHPRSATGLEYQVGNGIRSMTGSTADAVVPMGYWWSLQDIAQRAGGQFHNFDQPRETTIALLNDLITASHVRYVLRYTPTGVQKGGWHSLSVRIKRSGKFNISFKKGYDGGG